MALSSLARENPSETFPTSGGITEIIPMNERALESSGKGETAFYRDQEVIFLPRNVAPNTKELELEWWLGRVSEIHANYFTALLEDLNGKLNVVDFENGDVSPNEMNLLSLGAKFTYAITRLDKLDGREYKTKLAFSSKQTWDVKLDERANENANKLFPEYLLDL